MLKDLSNVHSVYKVRSSKPHLPLSALPQGKAIFASFKHEIGVAFKKYLTVMFADLH